MKVVSAFLRALCVVLPLAAVAGCVVHETAPGVYSPAPSPTSFDRSFDAVVGAFADQGVAIVQNDRAAGSVTGRSGNTAVNATVLRQADGSIRIEFGVVGDAAVKDRIVGSYNRRMGR